MVSVLCSVSMPTMAMTVPGISFASLHLGAQPVFLRAEFGREILAEILGLEDLPDFDLTALVVRIGATLDPLDRFRQRLAFPNPESGHQLFRLRKRSIG